MQCGSIVSGEVFLELSECFGGSVEILSISALLQTDGMFYELINTPCTLCGISIVWLTVTGVYNCHGFTFCISTAFCDDVFQVRSNAADIFHQGFRIGKNICINALQDKSACFFAGNGYQACIVDVTFPIGLVSYSAFTQVIGRKNFLKNLRFNLYHNIFSFICITITATMVSDIIRRQLCLQVLLRFPVCLRGK